MNIFKNKASLWPRFFKKRKSKKKTKTALAVKAPPKKHMTEPDRWKPPFEVKKTYPRKNGKQDLIVIDQLTNFELGDIAASIGVMLQIRLDDDFNYFVNECLERFKNLDWGGVTESEGRMNERRITARSGEVYGIYTYLRSGVQVWITTNFDKGATTICLADER